MKFILGCLILFFAHLGLASDDSRNIGDREPRTLRIVKTTIVVTTMLGVVGILPSLLADTSTGVLSTNPFANLSLELRTISWTIFGPGYLLWEGIRGVLIKSGAILIEAGLGGPMLVPSRLDSLTSLRCAAKNTYRIVVSGPNTLNYFCYYAPWVGFASLSGSIYGILLGILGNST